MPEKPTPQPDETDQVVLHDAQQDFLRSYPSTVENVFVQALTATVGYAELVATMLEQLLQKTAYDTDERELLTKAITYALRSREEGLIGVSEVKKTATIAQQVLDDPTICIPIRRLGLESVIDTR